MTPAERIAVFMGWKPCEAHPGLEDRQYRWYRKANALPELTQYIGIEIYSPGSIRPSSAGNIGFRRHHIDDAWPRLDSYDYLRTVEDAIAERCRYGDEIYGRTLTEIVKSEEDPRWLVVAPKDKVSWKACLRATCPQRVEAILRVIEAMGEGK